MISCLFASAAYADAWTDCGAKIASDGRFAQYVRGLLPNNNADAQTVLQQKATDIQTQLLDIMFGANSDGLCSDSILEIAQFKTLMLSFDINGIPVDFDINVDGLFDYYPTYTGILLAPATLQRADKTFFSNDFPDDAFWKRECATIHPRGIWVRDNVSVTKAAEPVFGSGTYLLDLHNQILFPGVLLKMPDGIVSLDNPNGVVMTHLPTALNQFKQFVTGLTTNPGCGGLSVYMISFSRDMRTNAPNMKFMGQTIKTIYAVDGPYPIRK